MEKLLSCHLKDGSWKPKVSGHPKGQIYADLVICPYCFMGEESIDMCFIIHRKKSYFQIINPFKSKDYVEEWANYP